MSRHRACDDFHRSSEQVRREYLGGRTALTRSQALGASLGAGLALYEVKAMPAERVLEAAAAEAAAAPTPRYSSRCSCRAAWTCSTRSSRSTTMAATRTSTPS